jgi:hypothetical protein
LDGVHQPSFRHTRFDEDGAFDTLPPGRLWVAGDDLVAAYGPGGAINAFA